MCETFSVALIQHGHKSEVACQQQCKICMTGRVLVKNFVMKYIMWVGNLSLTLSKHFISISPQVA